MYTYTCIYVYIMCMHVHIYIYIYIYRKYIPYISPIPVAHSTIPRSTPSSSLFPSVLLLRLPFLPFLPFLCATGGPVKKHRSP